MCARCVPLVLKRQGAHQGRAHTARHVKSDIRATEVVRPCSVWQERSVLPGQPNVHLVGSTRHSVVLLLRVAAYVQVDLTHQDRRFKLGRLALVVPLASSARAQAP